MGTFINQLLADPATYIVFAWAWVFVFARVAVLQDEDWFRGWLFVQLLFLIMEIAVIIGYTGLHARLVYSNLLLANAFLFFVPSAHFFLKRHFPEKAVTAVFVRIVDKFFLIGGFGLACYLLVFTLVRSVQNKSGIFGILGWIVCPVVLVIWVTYVTVISYMGRNSDAYLD